MLKEYKVYVAKALYGLIEGSASSLKELMIRNFKERWGIIPDLLEVNHTDKFTDNNLWAGTMTVDLCIGGENYSITRDWMDEYEQDKKHPDFESDPWFYEVDKSQGSKKLKEVLKKLA